jgi:hypothetical protein
MGVKSRHAVTDRRNQKAEGRRKRRGKEKGEG